MLTSCRANASWKIMTVMVVLSLSNVITVSSNKTDDSDWTAGSSSFSKTTVRSYDSEKSQVAEVKDEFGLLSKMSRRTLYSSPCKAKSQPKDPQVLFKTQDEFFPRSYVEKECTGLSGPRGHAVCGNDGLMHCVTRRKTLYFLRMLKSSSGCPTLRMVKIRNVPVDCDCMVPH